jgi:hypothetical protein
MDDEVVWNSYSKSISLCWSRDKNYTKDISNLYMLIVTVIKTWISLCVNNDCAKSKHLFLFNADLSIFQLCM